VTLSWAKRFPHRTSSGWRRDT